MSLSPFLQAIVQPSRWWRRQRTVEVTLWPRWIAQALCPHLKKHIIRWDASTKTVVSICFDCYKQVEEPNDCAHGEVRTHAYETVNLGRATQLAVRSYKCEHCGLELLPKELPNGVRITHLNAGMPLFGEPNE
jgi:hypothetical protein